MKQLIVSSNFDKVQFLESINNSHLKNEACFYQKDKRVDLTNDAYNCWNILKADVVRTFEPLIRQITQAESGNKFTSVMAFYNNKATRITENLVLPARSASNGYADVFVQAFQDGGVSPNIYNISVMSTLKGSTLYISNLNRLAYLYNLDYIIVVLSTQTILWIDVKKSGLKSNLFNKVEGKNNLKNENFIHYGIDLKTLNMDALHIMSYVSDFDEFYIDGEVCEIDTSKGYKQMMPYNVILANMPKTSELYTIYNFNNSKTYTFSLKAFAEELAHQMRKKLNIDISGAKLFQRLKSQKRRAKDNDVFEIYIKEIDTTYLFTSYKHLDTDIKEYQNKLNSYKCKLHNRSEQKYVKKADRPLVELKNLINTTRHIKPEDTLTNQDLEDLDLHVLQHKNSKKLSSEITPTTEFIYGGVCKDEQTSERNNTKYLPAFYNFEMDEYGKEFQMTMLKRALNSKYKDSIFFATWSGKKSLHITVWIDPCYRVLVSQNYKAYWRQTAEKIFGTYKCFDEQCATIAHPARMPNGIRYLDEENKYVIQSCWYLNKSPVGFRNDTIVDSPRKTYFQRAKEVYNDRDMEMVERNSSNDYGRIAYDVIVNNNIPSGVNYFNGLLSLFYINASKDFIQREYFDKVKKAHPSALGLNSLERYWVKYHR